MIGWTLHRPQVHQLYRQLPAASRALPGCRAVCRGRRLAVRASVQEGDQALAALKRLQEALSTAVDREDYAEAAQLRDAIKKLELADPVLQVRAQLEEAIQQERYEDAAKLRDRLAELQPPPPKFECPPVTSDTSTNGIRVTVKSSYVPSQSFPGASQYLFAYQIRITNEGQATVQLKNRYWLISDANFKTQEVRGPGVVGEQPVLAPGQSFEYQSACPLRTPEGSMEGHYEFVTRSTTEGGVQGWGQPFNVVIGRFGLTTSSLI